jgi:hypothetical protein
MTSNAGRDGKGALITVHSLQEARGGEGTRHEPDRQLVLKLDP